MTYTEFNRLVRKANLTLKSFAELLKMNPTSISNYAKKDEVPVHLAIIATLLSEMHEMGADYISIIEKIEIPEKKPRGADNFGNKQINLELK